MFRKNTRHRQIPLTSHVDELPDPLRERWQNSWAETFYREFFCRLDEQPFAVLYADQPSRPNGPVNVRVGLGFLKAANGWTDEEMYNEFCYNVQVRYALGYRHLGEGYFDLRTLYYFRERLARHMQETGENLLEQAFEQVTDEQLRAFSLKTGKQRMDSTLLASKHPPDGTGATAGDRLAAGLADALGRGPAALCRSFRPLSEGSTPGNMSIG